MNDDIYDYLKRRAKRERKPVFYSEIAPLAGLDMANPADRDKISGILGEISEYEVTHRRPMLSAIVVHKDGDKLPGGGFFELAKALHLYDGGDKQVFYLKEMTRVFDYWQGKLK